jgi:hypothetical protein
MEPKDKLTDIAFVRVNGWAPQIAIPRISLKFGHGQWTCGRAFTNHLTLKATGHYLDYDNSGKRCAASGFGGNASLHFCR